MTPKKIKNQPMLVIELYNIMKNCDNDSVVVMLAIKGKADKVNKIIEISLTTGGKLYKRLPNPELPSTRSAVNTSY